MRTISSRLSVLGLSLLACACEEGLQPVPFQGVSGTVHFAGDAPDSTEWVRLAVYRQIPGSSAELFGFVAFSDTLPLAAGSARFSLPLDTGTYHWVPAVWKRAGAPLGIASLRVLGWYSGTAAPFDPPKPFQVEPGGERAGIEITADFDTLLSAEEALIRVEGAGGS